MLYTLDNFTSYLLVFIRMTGMIAMNPVFSRRNVPALVRSGWILALTVLLAPIVGGGYREDPSTMWLTVTMLQELFIGFCCAMVFQVFYYMLFFAGDVIDTQMGLAMAKVFDPAINVQTSFSSSMITLLYLLYFFLTDSHLILIRLFIASFELVPVGAAAIGGEIAQFLLTVVTSAFSLALRLALPFIAAEFVLEISMGVLMKLIPQIHVFVINIQMKILLGIFMLLLFTQPIADFVDRYMEATLKAIQQTLLVLGAQ